MQSQQDVRVTVRVDKDLKKNAEKLFDHLGMNMSVAFNVFLRKAVDEQAIPFKIGITKPGNAAVYDTAMVAEALQLKVAEETAAQAYKSCPAAFYENESNEAHHRYPNGQKDSLIEKEAPLKKPRSELRGLLKGKVWMAENFDAPLEEMEEYM